MCRVNEMLSTVEKVECVVIVPVNEIIVDDGPLALSLLLILTNTR